MNFKQELDEVPSDDNRDLKSFPQEFPEIKYVKDCNPKELNPPSWIKKELFDPKTEQIVVEKPTQTELRSEEILEESKPDKLHLKKEPVDNISVERVRAVLLPAFETTSKSNAKREQILQCGQCSYKTSSRARLKSHIKLHLNVKSLACMLCTYETVYNSRLQAHLKAHAAQRPHKCTTCDYQSTSKSALKEHMSRHTGEKLHKCQLCSFSSGYKANLQKHVVTHTGEKPFKCSLCAYCSGARADLKIHMKTHSEKGPYQCRYCQYKGKAVCALRRHLKVNHSVELQSTPRKRCIVPQCDSTSSNTPDKLFISVPRDEKRRNLWIEAVQRSPSEFSKLTPLLVCEDHFDLEKDMDNYVKFKLVGGRKTMKSDVVPHIFASPADLKGAAPKSPRKLAAECARRRHVEELLCPAKSATVSNDNSGTEPSTSATNAPATKKGTHVTEERAKV